MGTLFPPFHKALFPERWWREVAPARVWDWSELNSKPALLVTSLAVSGGTCNLIASQFSSLKHGHGITLCAEVTGSNRVNVFIKHLDTEWTQSIHVCSPPFQWLWTPFFPQGINRNHNTIVRDRSLLKDIYMCNCGHYIMLHDAVWRWCICVESAGS